MPEITAEKILKTIEATPGLLAREIATKFGVTRKEVNSILYGKLKSKIRKDEKNRWYLVGFSKSVVERKKTVDKSSTFTSKPVTVESSSFPGSSLFIIKPFGNEVKIEVNKSHPFMAKDYEILDDSGKKAVNKLITALALVFEKHYSESDFIEELIDEWGIALKKSTE